MARKRKRKVNLKKIPFFYLVLLLLFGYYLYRFYGVPNYDSTLEIPPYQGYSYVTLNQNEPNFKEEDKMTESFERYSKLDYLNRCGVAYANIGIDLMPTTERGSIGSIKPSGWHQI